MWIWPHCHQQSPLTSPKKWKQNLGNKAYSFFFFFFFSSVLSIALLAQRGSCAEAWNPALQTRLLSVKRLQCLTPQLWGACRGAAHSTAIQDGGRGRPCAEMLHLGRWAAHPGPASRDPRSRELLAPPLLRRFLESSPRSGLSGTARTLQQELLLLRLSLLLNQSQSPSTGLNDTWQENNYGPNRKVPMPSAPISVLMPWETASLFRWGPQASPPFLSSLRFAGNKTLQ